MAQTILFASGSEFLVCKRVEKDDKVCIFLREIKLGLNKNAVLWCDDKITDSAMLKYWNWIRTAAYEQENQKFRELVTYNNSMKAREYIDSVFYKLSL